MKIRTLIPFVFIFFCNIHTPSQSVNIHLLHRSLINVIKPMIEKAIDHTGANTRCAKDLKTVLKDFILFKKYALQLVDSSAKIPSGLLNGNVFNTGDFDQCLSLRSLNGNITGQYCSVVISPSNIYSNEIGKIFDSIKYTTFVGLPKKYQKLDVTKFMKMTHGLCIPKSCSISHLQKLWDYIEVMFRIPLHLHFLDILCSNEEKKFEVHFHDKCIYVLFGLYAAFLFAVTFYDIFYNTKPDDEDNAWMCFSLYSNAKKIFSFSETSFTSESYLECLSGLKVFGMVWIILGHRVLANMFGATNLVYIHTVWKHTTSATLQTAGLLSVDMFFSFSGFLLSYGYFKYRSTITNWKNVNLIALQVYRLMRLWPALIAMILFYISVFKYLGEGPFWNVVATKIMDSCFIHGWLNVLFLNNYIGAYEQCMGETWYLAVDSQLFLIAPLLLVCMYKKPLKTSLFCLGACLVSAIYTFIITYANAYRTMQDESNVSTHNKNPFNNVYNREMGGYEDLAVYRTTFVRMPPWLIGFVAGVILFHYHRIKLQKVTVICAWAISLSTVMYLISIHLSFMLDDHDPITAALYYSAAKPMFSISALTIVFLCSTGHGGIINDFLSMKIFQVAVRLSYSVFLVHPAVIVYFAGSRKHAVYFSDMQTFRDLLSDIFFISIAAVICCLSFESPFIKLGRNVFKKEMKKQKAVEVYRKKK